MTSGLTQGRPRILIINPFGIGDVLFSTPLIRALREAFPEAHLAYLCNRRTQPILNGNPHLNEVFVYEKDELVALWKRNRLSGFTTVAKLLRAIRRRRFDFAIDLSLGERYSFLLALLGVPRRVGFDFRHRGRFLTERFAVEGYEDRHVVEYHLFLLRMIGVCALDRRLELFTGAEDREAVERCLAQAGVSTHQRLIGLVPAGGVSWGLQAQVRRWAGAGFAQVGQTLSERYGAKIMIFGEDSDHEACAQIAEAIGSSAVDLSGQTSLPQFVGLIARCDLVVSNDGGPLHIAASQDVPTVSIFGPVDPHVYGPYPRDPRRHQVIRMEGLPCRPCYHRFKLPPCPYEQACLTTISPEEIIEACTMVLETAGTRAAHG